MSRREGKGKASDTESGGYCDSKSRVEPEGVVRFILKEFPGVAADLEQVLTDSLLHIIERAYLHMFVLLFMLG